MSTQRRLLYERDAAQRRANDQRVINRRLNIVRNAWGDDVMLSNPSLGIRITWSDQPNRLNKYNLTCDCPLHALSAEERREEYQRREKIRVDTEYNDWADDIDNGLCESIYNEVMGIGE